MIHFTQQYQSFKIRLLLLTLLLLTSWHALAQKEPLPVDAAFQLRVSEQTSQSITLTWTISPGHYLYKDRFRFSAAPASQIMLGRTVLPEGIDKQDEILGDYQVYAQTLTLAIPVDIQPLATHDELTIDVHYQGCADDGYCYPPTAKRIHWPDTANLQNIDTVLIASTTPQNATTPANNNHAESVLESHEYWLILTTFLGFGLLLAFTPCVLPMLPILSGLILGHGKHLSHAKAFYLASLYVLGMALTYAALGVLASLAGAGLQALMQKPWIIALFSSLFVALALSLFGYYELRLPARLQNQLNRLSQQQTAGSGLGVMMMGVLSALLVSPCITPPLVGALTYMGNTGDVLLGGSALFAMGLGMGIPLILFVTLGAKLLPKSGPWMLYIERFFAVILLGVAIWLIDRVIPAALTLLLWAGLLVICAHLLGAFVSVRRHWYTWLAKALGIACFGYAAILFAAGLLGQTDVLQPFGNLHSATRHPFQRIKTVADLNQVIDTAKTQQKIVMLDFYADWCVACKKMEKHVFSKPAIAQTLQNCLVSIQADVTRADSDSRQLQKHLAVIAPPTLVFFDANGQELTAQRIVGEVSSQQLLQHLQQLPGFTC